jgi:hypothetical protein
MEINSAAAYHTTIDKTPRSVRSLFAKYESINHPVISEFISSIPNNFSDAVNKMMSSSFTSSSNRATTADHPVNHVILNNRAKLQKFIDKFHMEANTMTNGVSSNIKLLHLPTTKILVSIHQPNLFAYSGVFKKIVLLETLKNTIEKNDPDKKIINLFLIVDHDFMNGSWVRLAQLPSIRHSSGILELRLPVSNSMRWKMVSNMPIPGRTILEYWRKQINSWIRKNSFLNFSTSDDKSRVLRNFEEFWQEVEISYSRAKSYSDFNSFLMSQLVNKIWGYNTLFVRLTDTPSVFEDGFKYLISNFNRYSDVLRKTQNIFLAHGIDTGVSSSSYLNAPMWLHCRCGSKAHAKIQENQQQETILEGTCMSCKKYLHIKLDNHHHKLDLSNEEVIHTLSPRAIPILLLLSRDLGVECYASGIGGSMGYTVVASTIFRELSINMPLTLVWPSTDIYFGFGQSDALELVQLTKQSDIMTHIERLKQIDAKHRYEITPLIKERMRRINDGEPIQALLSDLFKLKEEQRKTRRLIKAADKVKNIVYMRPCFIDYAANFGMVNTEIQWRQNLLNNNNLAAPILMTTKVEN